VQLIVLLILRTCWTTIPTYLVTNCC